MAKVQNLEEPREGLIRQEIISYEEDRKGMITMLIIQAVFLLILMYEVTK